MKRLLRQWCMLMAAVLTITMLPLYGMSVWAAEVTRQSESNEVYESIEEATAYLRDEMIDRVQNVSVRIKCTAVTDIRNTVSDILDEAIGYKRGASGQAGDALASAISTWGCSCSSDGSVYTIAYEFEYYTTYEQEAELTAAVNNALAGLQLDNKTTYEKIKSIYDYICDHVDYDYDGLNDSSNTIKYTAYSAMLNGKAVCQGYAILFYRMCMDAGIPARIITGYGNGGAHAWNIVELNGYYYNVDVTWDGQDSETRHNYFLKNEADFSDHYRSSKYNTAEFNAQFPTPESSYIDISSLEAPMEATNFNYSFETIDGDSASSNASGKPKLLIFFSSSCGNSIATISSVANAEFGDTDIICLNTLDSGDLSATIAFSETYGNGSMVFSACANVNKNAMWSYVRAKFGTTSSIYWPVIVYIDSNNKLQHVTTGYQGAGTIRSYVDYYCNNIINELPHNHIYSDAWLKDENSHWHICVAEGCNGGVVSDKAAHTAGDWIVDNPATTEEAGSQHKECTVCGYVMQTESIDNLQQKHEHAFSAEWTSNANYHWHICTAGGCDGTVSGKAVHTAGDWIIDKAATTQEEGSRHKQCTVCGYTLQTESIPKLTPDPEPTPEIDMNADTSKYFNVTTNGGTWDGTHYYLPSGQMVKNSFFSDGTYTYYLQADGTPMKDRLTYHPDGVHVIYFNAEGHEVFSDFAHISKSIAGTDVDDMCFFNVYGYMYVDTLTYDKTGTKLYYVNPYGVLERNGWFQFSGHEFEAGLGFSGKAGGYGYADSDCSLMINTYTYDWNGNYVYMQGDGHMMR